MNPLISTAVLLDLDATLADSVSVHGLACYEPPGPRRNLVTRHMQFRIPIPKRRTR